MGKNIFQIVVYEGALICIMAMSYWKALGSPKLDTSSTLLKAFNGHMFQPHGIITSLPIQLGGNILFVVVEVIHTPLE